MYMINGLNCCGAIELVGINQAEWTPKSYLMYYARQYDLAIYPAQGKAFVAFSYAWDVKSSGTQSRTSKQGVKRMKAWKDFIEDNELGIVTIIRKSSFNPNYAQNVRIRAGIWVPDNQAIAKFVIAKKWIKGPPKKSLWRS